MKKLMVAGFLLAGILGANAQNVASTTTLTSGGNLAGTAGLNGTYYGYQTGKVTTGSSNVFIGASSGISNTTGRQNLFCGTNSGLSNITGNFNVYLGLSAGDQYSSGTGNTFTGHNSGSGLGGAVTATGFGINAGSNNSFYGVNSGKFNTNGNQNSFFGANAGSLNTLGIQNTYLGFNSGATNNGSNNIYIGANSGPVCPNQTCNTLSNNLYIDNTTNNNPLIWGDFALDQLKLNGKVAIGGNGTTAFGTIPTTVGGISVSTYNLFVKGGILTEEMRVGLASTWADYVFSKDYNLKPLSEVEAFIAKNKHLPNVPSAAQVKEEGINVGEMAKIQQEKIEELTLYIIAQNKRLEALEAKMSNK
jgi:hypothetical protein